MPLERCQFEWPLASPLVPDSDNAINMVNMTQFLDDGGKVDSVPDLQEKVDCRESRVALKDADPLDIGVNPGNGRS